MQQKHQEAKRHHTFPAVCLKRGTKKEKYVTVINKELFPKDKTLLIKFLKKGLNNLKSFKNNIFTEESYQNAINLIKEIIKNFN